MKMMFQKAALAMMASSMVISLPSFVSSLASLPPKRNLAAVAAPTSISDKAISAEVSLATSPYPDKRKRKKRTKSYYRGSPKLNARERSIVRGRDPILSLNMNLDYLAKSGQKDASKRAEEMLLRIEALHADGYYEKPPDVCSYNSVMNAYAQCQVSDASGQAKLLIERMKSKGLRPNSISYNTWMRCIAKEVGANKDKGVTGQPDAYVMAIEKAEKVLFDMEEQGLANTISYNTIISLYSKTRLKDAAERAEAWLRRMITAYNETGNEDLEPDTWSFNSVIDAYAKSDADGAATRAEDLLNHMEAMYEAGNGNLKADVITYSSCVNAYARASKRDKSAAQKAVKLLDRMERLSEQGDDDVKPNKKTYTAVINAFGRAGDAHTADAILTKMKERFDLGDASLKPDTILYSSVIDAYAKSGGEESSERAEELLQEMIGLYRMGNVDVKPNTRTYCSVITALARSKRPRAAEKAESVLEEMENYSLQGAKDLAPNTICYNAVIDAFARSNTVSKAYRAELLLERMIEEFQAGNLRVRPDTITYNSVLNAAARSVGDSVVRKEAYLIALNAFKTLHNLDYCKPSSISFVLFLKVLGNLVESGDNRDYMVEKVFKLCIDQGLVNQGVVTNLKRACSPLVFRKLVTSVNDSQPANPTTN